MLKPGTRLALYMERAFSEGTGKLGLGVLRYSPNPVVCLVDSDSAGKSCRELTGMDTECPLVPDVSAAARLGAEALVLGTAPPGGKVPADWWPALDQAVAQGLSLVNGSHDRLAQRYPELRSGQFVWDVRTEPEGLSVGTAAARLHGNKRVLMIGTDMSVGKMTAGLEITKSARQKGIKAAFVATGQTGIVICGSGVPLDAVRLDFASGAIEAEMVKCQHSELVVIEGQGSLIHPGSSANLPLLRGGCPTHLVLCHRANMDTLARIEWVKVPDLLGLASLYEDLAEACGVFPRPRTVGVCLNTGHMAAEDATAAIDGLQQKLGLPVCDPVRQGAGEIVDAVLA